MRATRRDVAVRAGVSEASVSYVLNKSRSVSPATIKKVMDAVNELNYSVDMVARSMVKNETKQLAILANDLSNPYFAEIFTGFENAAIDNGYLVSICTGQREIEKYITDLIARRIDGVFITAMPYMPYESYYDIITKMVASGVKAVISGSILGDCAGISHVEPLYIKGIDEAILHLKNLGHRNIAMISTFEQHNTFDKRDEMFNNVMEKYLPGSEKIFIGETRTRIPDMDSGYHLMQKLLTERPDITAVLCINDMTAYGAIMAAYDMNKSVPEDVSVIGIDDINISTKFRPALTTISFDKQQYGKLAFHVLQKQIKYNQSENVSVDTKLVVRNSTGKIVKRPG